MFEINYTNTLDEIVKGYNGIYKKYQRRRMIMYVIGFAILTGIGVDFIIKNPSGIPGYLVTGIGLAMIVTQIGRPIMARNKMVKALMGMYEENYSAKFYDNRIEIETEILYDNNAETEVVAITKFGIEKVENPEIIDKVLNENSETETDPNPQPETTVITIAEEELFSEEDGEMFRLYVGRRLVYIFPKRCMDKEQAEKLSLYFTEKSI